MAFADCGERLLTTEERANLQQRIIDRCEQHKQDLCKCNKADILTQCEVDTLLRES